jgi:haloalkane dehalogenase
MTPDEYITQHRAAGRDFEALGVRSFVREEGAGPTVLCLHGVPSSSYLYRKVLPELAARGLRGVAFDLPGLGLAARPPSFDYTWTGLGRFATAAVEALGLDRVHLVVHDIGGPVGFELTAAVPDRVASLTLLNTLVEVDRFRRPLPFKPYAVPVLGEIALALTTERSFVALMRRIGVLDWRAIDPAEIAAHVRLLKEGDGGRAFLKIMRRFELTTAKRDLYRSVVGGGRHPVQVVWGRDDPALRLDVHGEQAREATRGAPFHAVAGKHFLQEDQARVVAERVASFVLAAPPSP